VLDGGPDPLQQGGVGENVAIVDHYISQERLKLETPGPGRGAFDAAVAKLLWPFFFYYFTWIIGLTGLIS